MKHPDEEEPSRPTGEPPTFEAARKKAVEEYANDIQEFIKPLRKRLN
jgi:hypothetical protein